MRYFLQKDRFQDRVLNIRKRFSAVSSAILMVILLFAPDQLFADDVEINETNFPDPAFRKCIDSLATIRGGVSKITVIDTKALSKKGIKDLTGLKYLTNLTTLYCQNNPGVTSIDLSGNAALQVLNITGCKVVSLDFTHNPVMTNINCSEMQTLQNIDVSKCSKLIKLYVPNNPLTTLDVSNNTKLSELSVYKTKLTTLDLSKNTALTKLYAFGNPQLNVLDLSSNTNLTYLAVYTNKWSTLDVSKLTKLSTLLCFSNQLTTLNLSQNTSLKDLSCYSNQLTTLDLSKNSALVNLDCHSNKLTSLTLNPTDATQIKFLSIYDNALASFDMSQYSSLMVKNTSSFVNPSSGKQHRRMMLYTDGTDAYMLVEKGIDKNKISDAKINFQGNSNSISFTLGDESNSIIPLKFSNGSSRTRFFSWASTTKKASPITITYKYDTASSLSVMQTMDVTDTVECYLLPMSQTYGSVNLPYDVLLPAGATAYAISATDVKTGSNDNTATMTQIATEGEIVKANTPMLIKRSNDSYQLFALNQSTGTAKEASTNLLQGTQNYAITNQDTYYVLGINDNPVSSTYNQLGFWHSTKTSIGTWRAYLNSTDASAAKGFVLSLDAPTGISRIENAESSVDAPWYTLDGRTLGAKPSRQGIYIHNRKKITISK